MCRTPEKYILRLGTDFAGLCIACPLKRKAMNELMHDAIFSLNITLILCTLIYE